MEKTTVAEIKTKYKSFHYQTELKWVGQRAGMIGSNGKPEFRVASPPEFKGEAGVWTPEDLFVASVEACTMTTFIAFAERRNLAVVSYTSFAEGVLENIRGDYLFTKIILKPTIVLTKETDQELAQTILDDAHGACFIANSVLSEVFLEPKFEIA